MNGWRSVTAQCCFFLFLLSNTVFRSWLSEGTCYWCAQFVLPGYLPSGWAQINLSQSQWAKANAGSFQVELRVSFLLLLMLFSSSALQLCWQETPKLCLQPSAPKASWISAPSVLLSIFFDASFHLSFKVRAEAFCASTSVDAAAEWFKAPDDSKWLMRQRRKSWLEPQFCCSFMR